MKTTNIKMGNKLDKLFESQRLLLICSLPTYKYIVLGNWAKKSAVQLEISPSKNDNICVWKSHYRQKVHLKR